MSAFHVLRRVNLDSRHCPTGKTKHYIGETALPPPAALEIVSYPDEQGFYLLYLDDAGNELTDTFHETIDKAMAQAEWEFSVQPNEWTDLELH
ncbi:MAG: hypothetical protein ACRERU_16430 [Methylococcales bacterium]